MGHHHDEAEDEQIPFRLEGAARRRATTSW